MLKKIMNKMPLKHSKHTVIMNPTHYYLASYPKSGNTWARFLLAYALTDASDTISFKEIGKFIPDSHRNEDISIINDNTSIFNNLSRQIIKTHAPYCTQYNKSIYLIRDGRDVLTSYYHWINARKESHVKLIELIQGNMASGLWGTHVLGWLEGPCNKKLILKYEDFLKDTVRQLELVFSFLDLPSDKERIIKAIELASFKKMQNMERNDGLFDGHQESSKKSLFVRSGSAGDWKSLFTKSDIDLFWTYHGRAMEAAGYSK